MNILLDECVPQRFATLLPSYNVKTVPEIGWAGIKNGQLLNLAARDFDVMITVDKKMAIEQDHTSLKLPVMILQGRSTQFKHLKHLASDVIKLLDSQLTPGFRFVGG